MPTKIVLVGRVQQQSLFQVVYAEQHLMYDLNDVLNGIGGSLGLFLGMSLLGLADWVAREWRKRKRGKQEADPKT